ncbi:glycosyltransferase family 92 protein [Cobetia sp. UIB-001]|uniref:glycosyltransferase family 92 protein n=1 Tax=Cobetia sp. UIB-001 TaxID=2717697 RepID=UPI00384C9F96
MLRLRKKSKEIDFAVVAIVKNEALYLKEWLTHYRNLGVTHFFIADNGSTDGTQNILNDEFKSGDVTWETWVPSVKAQITWYKECLSRFGNQCQWMAFFDIDEFLVNVGNKEGAGDIRGLVGSLLDKPKIGGIAINWRIYGSSGYNRFQPGAVTWRFNKASKFDRAVNQHVKCIFRPERVKKVFVHAPELISGFHYITPRGDVACFLEQDVKSGRTEEVCKEKFVINHYNVKSQCEFIDIKASRGRANLGADKSREMSYFLGHDLNDEHTDVTEFNELQKQHYNDLSVNTQCRNPFFFVHIPKTAGTSFRLGAAEFFEKSNIWHDYGAMSKETHPEILRNIYELKDGYAFASKVRDKGVKLIAGHTPASKYLSVTGIRNTISFLRDPVQRVMSDYNHFVRHNNYAGTLEDFVSRPELQNRQAKFLAGAPIQCYGFIGLTEDYQHSLEIINSNYGLSIPSRQDNVCSAVGREHTITSEERELIEKYNGKDLELYKEAKRIFSLRVDLHKAYLPYVHGGIQNLTKKNILGWAWWSLTDEPVEIDILVNGFVVGRVTATHLRPGMLRWGAPREGYVGFHYDFKKPVPVGAVISCRAVMTGQTIDSSNVMDD